jgi:GTP cyclohydrolase I
MLQLSDTYCGCVAESSVSRASSDELAGREERLSSAVKTILECIGEDPHREGLLNTPKRYAKALLWLTKGYDEQLSRQSSRPIYISHQD